MLAKRLGRIGGLRNPIGTLEGNIGTLEGNKKVKFFILSATLLYKFEKIK